MTREEWYQQKRRALTLGRVLSYEIMDPIKEQDDAPKLAVPMAYVLLKHLENGADISSPEAFVESLEITDEKEKNRRLAFYKGRLEQVWNVITEAPARIKFLSSNKARAVETLKSIALFYDFTKTEKNYYSMPESIAELAVSILDLKEDDRVCEYCAGRGTFTVLASQIEPKAAYTAVEKDALQCELASIRLDVTGGGMKLVDGDMFAYKSKKKFTKAFMNYDFAMRKVAPAQDADAEGTLLATVNNTEIRFADWQFIASVLDGLEDGGKAVVVTTIGSLSNGYDKKVRQIFIDRGYIDAVIALPGKLFKNTAIPVTLLVLTKRTAADEVPKAVKMVEASHFYKDRRFTNVIEQDDLEEILYHYTEDTDYGKNVPVEEIVAKDYVLAADRYFEKVSLSNSRDFGEFIWSIKRGTPMKAEELKSIETDEPGCEYLAIGNIVDGYIDRDSLKHIKPNEALAAKLANYRINNGDLIISKGGNPFKIAVADDIPEGTQLIASGNLYVIEIDRNKGLPYFFKAFFESKKGRKLLNGAAVGSVISMISAEAIRKLQVPDYPLYEQKRIADEMKDVTATLRDRTARYKESMQKLRDKASNLCKEWNTDSTDQQTGNGLLEQPAANPNP